MVLAMTVGALLAYLFDPVRGYGRRERFAHAVQSTVKNVVHAQEQVMDTKAVVSDVLSGDDEPVPSDGPDRMPGNISTPIDGGTSSA